MTKETIAKMKAAAEAARNEKQQLIETISTTTTTKQLLKLIPDHPKHFTGLEDVAEAMPPKALQEMMLLRLGHNPHKQRTRKAPRPKRNDIICGIIKSKSGKQTTHQQLVKETIADFEKQTGEQLTEDGTGYAVRFVVDVLKHFNILDQQNNGNIQVK